MYSLIKVGKDTVTSSIYSNNNRLRAEFDDNGDYKKSNVKEGQVETAWTSYFMEALLYEKTFTMTGADKASNGISPSFGMIVNEEQSNELLEDLKHKADYVSKIYTPSKHISNPGGSANAAGTNVVQGSAGGSVGTSVSGSPGGSGVISGDSGNTTQNPLVSGAVNAASRSESAAITGVVQGSASILGTAGGTVKSATIKPECRMREPQLVAKDQQVKVMAVDPPKAAGGTVGTSGSSSGVIPGGGSVSGSPGGSVGTSVSGSPGGSGVISGDSGNTTQNPPVSGAVNAASRSESAAITGVVQGSASILGAAGGTVKSATIAGMPNAGTTVGGQGSTSEGDGGGSAKKAAGGSEKSEITGVAQGSPGGSGVISGSSGNTTQTL